MKSAKFHIFFCFLYLWNSYTSFPQSLNVKLEIFLYKYFPNFQIGRIVSKMDTLVLSHLILSGVLYFLENECDEWYFDIYYTISKNWKWSTGHLITLKIAIWPFLSIRSDKMANSSE